MPKSCIACGCHITHPIYHTADKPLAALHLPRSRDDARQVLTYPMNYRACAVCGHIFNTEFDYHRVPYEDNSNLMYNASFMWQQHLTGLRDHLVSTFGARNSTIIDIGCGDGGFLSKFLEMPGFKNRCIGFEPGIEADNASKRGVETFRDYFVPQRDLQRFKPGFLFCRHVLEHLQNPREFLTEIAYWCGMYELTPVFVAEVPCIDKAIEHTRISDFLYEHVSNFTHKSLVALFTGAGFDIVETQSCYDDEVLVLYARPGVRPHLREIWQSSREYCVGLKTQTRQVSRTLMEMRTSGRSVCFWGATGKGAAFLNAYDLTDEEFPVVVDSDENKVGRFVPHTAQQIRSARWLAENPVDVIVITTYWRAKDIYHEILERGIAHKDVYVVHRQRLMTMGEAGLESGHPSEHSSRTQLQAELATV